MDTVSADMRWPTGKSVAVVFNVAYETWQEGHVSGVGPMGNPLRQGLFDTNADSYGRYGANGGIQRLMRLLDRHGVAADVFLSGALAERYLDQVRDMAARGHGIVGHGYTQDGILAQLSAEQEKHSIDLTTDLITQATGVQPTGWISPRATPGPLTRQHLVRRGYIWQSDSIDSALPYFEQFDGGRLLAIPLTVEINDLSHSMRFGRTPQQFVEMFDYFLDGSLEHDDDLTIIDVLVHTHCYGRPIGAWAFEDIIRRCVGRDDIWITTRDNIARYIIDNYA